jgi:hypothetical protein
VIGNANSRINFFFKHQKQKIKEENARREGKRLGYFVSKFLKKNSKPFLVSNLMSTHLPHF